MTTSPDQKKFFNAARREYIDKPFKQPGFMKYKTSTLARMTAEQIFQFLNFQRSSGHQFTVNVGIRPMCCYNHDSLTLLPGDRLGFVAGLQHDKWWDYDTEERARASFKEVKQLLEDHVMPFFDSTRTVKDILSAYETGKFSARIRWGSRGWVHHDLGHLYLRLGDEAEAIRQMKLAMDVFEQPNWDWVIEGCNKFLELTGGDQDQIEQYFSEMVTRSRETLGLGNDW